MENEVKLAETIADIAKLASEVATQHADSEAAFEAENNAEAAILTAVIDAARPALRALCSRLRSSELTFWPDSISTATSSEYHAERGFHLAGKSSPESDHPRANSGRFEGRGLYLLSNGSLAIRSFTGTWSRWQGADTAWESTLNPVTPWTAVEIWSLSAIVARIADGLRKQIEGDKPKVTRAARERAERLSALAKLL